MSDYCEGTSTSTMQAWRGFVQRACHDERVALGDDLHVGQPHPCLLVGRPQHAADYAVIRWHAVLQGAGLMINVRLTWESNVRADLLPINRGTSLVTRGR